MMEIREIWNENSNNSFGHWKSLKRYYVMGVVLLSTAIIAIGYPYGVAYCNEQEKKYRDELELYQLSYLRLIDETKSKKRKFLKAVEAKKDQYIGVEDLQKYLEHEGLTILRLEESVQVKERGIVYELSVQGSFPLVVSFLGDFHNFFPFAKLTIKNVEGHEGLVKLEALCYSMVI